MRSATRSGQPILIGTVTVEKSEEIARILRKNGIKHNILNAKNHEREAEIVAQAGRLGRGHHRDQHGGARHGHTARRQPRISRQKAHARRGSGARNDRACHLLRGIGRRSGGQMRRHYRELYDSNTRRKRTRKRNRSSPRGGFASSAPSGTNPAVSTISCAAAAVRQGDPGVSVFLHLSRRRPHQTIRRRDG